MWWGRKKEEPPQAQLPAPSPYQTSGTSALLQQYLTAANQMQQQNAQFLRGYGGQSISGWSNQQFQSSLPPDNLAIIALQSALGKKQTKWTHEEAVCLEKATHFLEAFFTQGKVHDWEAFLSICAAAKTGNLEELKGTTTAALLGEKKNG